MIPPRIGISATAMANKMIEGSVNTAIKDSLRLTCVSIAKIMVPILKIMPSSFLENIKIKEITMRNAIHAGITFMKILSPLKTSLC